MGFEDEDKDIKHDNRYEFQYQNQIRNLTGEQPILSDESMSTVSAITFEYSNLGPLEAKLPPPAPLSQYTTMMNSVPITPLQSNKSSRLSNVHDRVITMQKENKNLKEKNLRLMLEMSSNNNNRQSAYQKRDENIPTKDTETKNRLAKIYDK